MTASQTLLGLAWVARPHPIAGFKAGAICAGLPLEQAVDAGYPQWKPLDPGFRPHRTRSPIARIVRIASSAVDIDGVLSWC